MSENTREKYGDIIDLEYNGSRRQNKIAPLMRAAQFSPFAALSGHSEALSESARLTNRRPVLSDEDSQILNSRLNFLKEHILQNPTVTVTFFSPDIKKEGGKIDSVKKAALKLSEFERTLYLEGGLEIPFDDLLSLDGEIFENLPQY